MKEYTYSKKYECLLIMSLFLGMIGCGGIWYLSQSFDFVLIYVFLFLLLFPILIYFTARNYELHDVVRHLESKEYKNKIESKVKMITKGQCVYISAIVVVNGSEVLFQDKYRYYDGFLDLKVGDPIYVKYEPENLNKFAIVLVDNCD